MSGPGTVVIGLGSPLMGDDGLGIAALDRLRDGWRFDPAVTLVDGGTWSMNVLHVIEEADRLLLLDAIRAGMAPGSLVVLERDRIPRMLAAKVSPHQSELRETLALAELRGRLPADTVAMGLEPAIVELSTELSTVLGERLADLEACVVDRLVAWGHRVHRRPLRAIA